ncbi:uncharacterized protein LOC113763268 [Coffea eugenioides]|uniref:uncharacterized protein LOC113763268 n=1 Tax=Coffea eugenioides TaxID=49369 RepID=UPI000F609092|nr:uncharacterized protein LOC113763268 [Coffea eugenioides]
MEEDEGDNKPKTLEFVNAASHQAKLKELLRNLTSTQSKLCSDASKEFIKILKSDSGPQFLTFYIQSSPKCVELQQAWELRQGKPGFSHCLKLVSAIFRYPFGKDSDKDVSNYSFVSSALDKFARVITEGKMGDLYEELNSKVAKRQKAVLLLLASIVRRGPGLAWEVAKGFDFKTGNFSKLAEWKARGNEGMRRYLTRKEFVGFAMSFLEVGNPRLLRGILQQKDMYSGVLRGLGNDDEEIVVYVLLTLRNRVLVPESLVPPGLRSVLFGSATLEQLISISGRQDGGLAAEVAHSVLVMVCTDPSNGLMPDLERQPNPLKGNVKRLVDLMKKLKPTEVEYHKDLLLAIVKGRPAFGSAYLENFPHNLEDLASPNWFSAISLAADVMSSVGDGFTCAYVNSQSQEPPSIDNLIVQDIMKCIGPRPFTRLVMNKGLLHSDPLVKHVTLRLVSEELKLLDFLIGSVNDLSSSSDQVMHKWASFKRDVQNVVQILLPDPQVLLSLLSSLSGYCKSPASRMKRAADVDVTVEHNLHKKKKLKMNSVDEDMDILVSGVSSTTEGALTENDGVSEEDVEDQLNSGVDLLKPVLEIWGLQGCSSVDIRTEDGDTYFYSKLLDVLRIYHRTLPTAVEGSFDFFKVLPSNPLALPTILQQSMLSLLVEQVVGSNKSQISIRTQPLMYKYLHSFINLFMYSPIRDIKDQAYSLAQAAMLSTGAFDRNPREISAWFLFIPGYTSVVIDGQKHGIEVFQKLSSVVISFLCDAVSTTGNNLFKYLDLLRVNMMLLADTFPNFSPFIVCVLEKCLRLLSSETGSFTLPEKSMISLYVSTTLKYLLETQVEGGLLCSLTQLLISERLKGCCDMIGFCPCEWMPMNSLLYFARNTVQQQIYSSFMSEEKATGLGGSFSETLSEVNRILRTKDHCGLLGVTMGFSFSMICTTADQILQNFPSTISTSTKLLGVPFSILLLRFFLEPSHFAEVFKLWPKICFAGVDKVISGVHDGEGQTIANELDDSPDSASIAFSFLVKNAPFHVLFPAIFFTDGLHLLGHSKVQNLLLDKFTESTPDFSVSSLCRLLFCLLQARLAYRIKPSDELEKLCESSCFLAKHIVKQSFVEKFGPDCSPRVLPPLSSGHIREVAGIILGHPLLTALLEWPLHTDNDVGDMIFMKPPETFLQYAERGVRKIDHHILQLLRRTTSELLVHVFSKCRSPSVVDHSTERIAKAFKALVQKLFLTFKARFTDSRKTDDLMPLIPTLYALHSLSEFICPFELLNLVHWLFSRIDLNDTAVSISCQRCGLSVGLQIASWAFDSLSLYMLEPHAKRTLFNFFMGTGNRSFEITLFERIFNSIFEIATHTQLEVADICLFKAVKIIKMHKCMEKTSLPFVMATSRLLPSVPVNFISYCLDKTTKTKCDFLFLLSEMSSLHLCVFGHLVSGKISNNQALKVNKEENCNRPQYSEEFLMLLPTVLLYLRSNFLKFGGQFGKHVENTSSFFWKILLRGFSNWKSFVSEEIFEIKLVECSSLCMEDFSNLFSSSLLGKAVLLMRHYLAVSGHLVKMKRLLSTFDSVCPHASAQNDLLDCDAREIGVCSLELSLNFVNKIIAKICLCWMLLFPEHNNLQSVVKDGKKKGIESEVSILRIRFLSMLVHSWQRLVENFHTCRQGENIRSSLFRFLEIFIAKNIVALVREMHDCLVELHSLPFLDQLAKYSLLHRFDDPTTIRMLRIVLISLSEGKFLCISILQLLLAHSQFAPTILFAHSSTVCTQFGMSFAPAPSIMRLFTVLHTEENTVDGKKDAHETGPHMKKLELIKLLRVLIHILGQQHYLDSETSNGLNLKELVLVLLSSYGATMDEIDLEMYSLMNEIEAIDKSVSEGIAEMDFLWGSASLKVRQEREQKQSVSSLSNSYDNEVVGERRRIQFRENLPIDTKLCAKTVLCFPHDRFADGSLSKLQTNDSDEGYNANSKKVQLYDPVFILRFSIHSLAMEYIEPLEFASLGLLAITFISLSSPDADTRKLGYEAVVRFKSAVEKCRKRKDVMRLRLLVSYLQNGIEEECQRIPSITAVFIAEASFVLLDSSHDHYSAISKCLMRSSGANMKGVPLFQEFFWSSSVTFKSERLWMLRLLNTSLTMDDDAQILVRNSIFEILLNFYASPLSDDESKELIVEMVKKSVKINKLAWHLVVRCGIISWLSSHVASFYGILLRDQRSFSFAKLAMVLEVANDVIMSRNTSEWLQKYALEQLSELAAHLYRILVGCSKHIQEKTRIIDLILELLMSTLKISQKRKVYQPHFTISFEGLYHLYEAVDVCCSGTFSSTAEIGLKAVLMSTPPVSILHMDKNKLLKFVSWAISTAVQSNLMEVPESEAMYSNALRFSEQSEEDLVSKLLRWLTASVILGRLSWKLSDLNSTSSSEILKLDNLHCIMDYCVKECGENQENFGSKEILAVSIFYLQQLAGIKWNFLPSVVAALSLLLFSGPSSSDSDSRHSDGSPWVSLCQKIHSPAEANPSWRWSYYQPWRDLSLKRAAVEKLEEIHACQKLLVLILKKLGNNSLCSQFLSLQDVENFDVFKWERSIIEPH